MPEQPAQDVALRDLAPAGDAAGLTEPGVWIVRTAAQWQGLLGPGSAAPDVDWESTMVVVVALGMRNTGGYDVRIEQLTMTGSTLKVAARERQPGPDAFVTQALTYPYHAVATAKRDCEPSLTMRVESR